MFRCGSCTYQSARKAGLLRHLQGKRNTCFMDLSSLEKMEAEAQFPCRQGCSKVYRHEQNRFKHERSCATQATEVSPSTTEVIDTNNSNSIVGGHHNSITVDNSHTDNSTQVTVNVNITSFDDFKPSRITIGKFTKLMAEGVINTIVKCLEEQQFDPSKPENMNVFISNLKDNIARVFDGSSWKARKGDEVLEDIVHSYLGMVNQSIDEFEEEKLSARAQKKIDIWEKTTGHEGFEDRIKSNVKYTLYNNRGTVKDVHGVKQRIK